MDVQTVKQTIELQIAALKDSIKTETSEEM